MPLELLDILQTKKSMNSLLYIIIFGLCTLYNVAYSTCVPASLSPSLNQATVGVGVPATEHVNVTLPDVLEQMLWFAIPQQIKFFLTRTETDCKRVRSKGIRKRKRAPSL